MRRSRDQQKKLDDDARLLRAWTKFHRDELEHALGGPHGAIVERIVGFLQNMDIHSAPALLTLLRDYDWRRIDADVKLILLHEIDQSICALRQRAGLPVIDDALWDERPTGFLIIRELLGAQEKHVGDSPTK
jgi:hypothetical protein